MQKVSSRNLRSGPEEGKYLPFDPTLSKISAWLTSLPASQISPQSLRSGRGIQESLQLFQHSCVIHSGLPRRLHSDDSSRVCSSTEALETSEPLSPRMCVCRSDPYGTAPSSGCAQRDNQRELGARAQRTYIHGGSSNRMSPYTCGSARVVARDRVFAAGLPSQAKRLSPKDPRAIVRFGPLPKRAEKRLWLIQTFTLHSRDVRTAFSC